MNPLTQKAPDATRLRRPHKLLPLCFVSEATRTDAMRIFELLTREGSELTTVEIEDIKRLVDESPRNETALRNDSGRNIFNVVNWDGFTLLQRAVINNQIAVVKLLLKKGCDVNAGICSLPLHLACRLGHVQIAQLLLTHGARADLECTVCYPEEHKLKTCPDQIYCLAYQPVYTPIMYALCGDNDLILTLLVTHENSRQLVKTDFLLHEACKMGSNACALYLLQHYSEQMSQENSEGKTPLQISLVMDADSAIFLVQNGAKLDKSVFLTPDTGSTLHELYRSKTSLGLVKATKFAVENGFRSHINVRDQDGNTALYVLLRHVGRTVKSSIQSEYDREVQESVKLLLHHGSNPNIPNHVGENALHSALSDNTVRQLYVSRHGQVRRLKVILQEIYKVAEILLAHGADAGQRCMAPACLSPLYYAVRIFQSLQPDMFVVVKTALKQLFVLLCRDTCNVNATDACGLTVYLQLLNASHRWISACPSNIAFCRTIPPFLTFMLQHLLKHGMDANASLTYWNPRMDETVESNYFKEILMFINLQVPADVLLYENVRYLLVQLLQRGGNPNLLTFNTQYSPVIESVTTSANATGTVTGVPSNAPITFILARSLFTQTDKTLPLIIQVLNLFHLILRQNKLNEFITAVQHYISLLITDEQQLTKQQLTKRTTTNSVCAGLHSSAQIVIDNIAHKPRSLRQLARISISENLEWRLAKRVVCLPLPKPLQQYLITFDM